MLNETMQLTQYIRENEHQLSEVGRNLSVYTVDVKYSNSIVKGNIHIRLNVIRAFAIRLIKGIDIQVKKAEKKKANLRLGKNFKLTAR